MSEQSSDELAVEAGTGTLGGPIGPAADVGLAGTLSMMLKVRRPGVMAATHVPEGAGMIRAPRGRIVVLDGGKLEDLAGDSYGPAEGELKRLLAEP